MPSRRATAIACDHNSSGIRDLPLRVSLQSSKRARTSPMPGVSPDLRSVISIPPCRSNRWKNEVNSYDSWISCRLTEGTLSFTLRDHANLFHVLLQFGPGVLNVQV